MRDPSFASRFVAVLNNGICVHLYKRVFDAVSGVEHTPMLLCSGQYATNFYTVLQQLCDEHAQTQTVVMGQQHKIDRVIKKNDRLEGELLRLSCELHMQQEANAQLERERAAAWTDLPEAEPGMFDEDVTEVRIDRLISSGPNPFPDNSGTDDFRSEVTRG